MSSYRFVRRVNTGNYSHDEYEAVETTEVSGENAHLVAVRKIAEMMAAVYGGQRDVPEKLQQPEVVKRSDDTFSPVTRPTVVEMPVAEAPSIVSAQMDPALSDAELGKFARLQAERINRLRPGRGGLEINQITAKYTLPEAGISRIGVIGPTGEAVDPSAKAAYRQGWMADIEAIQ